MTTTYKRVKPVVQESEVHLLAALVFVIKYLLSHSRGSFCFVF
jgi:hypothetical protein